MDADLTGAVSKAIVGGSTSRARSRLFGFVARAPSWKQGVST